DLLLDFPQSVFVPGDDFCYAAVPLLNKRRNKAFKLVTRDFIERHHAELGKNVVIEAATIADHRALTNTAGKISFLETLPICLQRWHGRLFFRKGILAQLEARLNMLFHFVCGLEGPDLT